MTAIKAPISSNRPAAFAGVARRDLAVITISTNEKQWIDSCLASVFAHAGDATLDVIVVDNESTDGTRELVESRYPQARVVPSRNGGFGYANNRGWEAASARYALFLNPDTEIVDGTFGELVAAFDERPEVGLIGVKQLTGDRELYPTMRRFPGPMRSLSEALLSERWPWRPGWAGERVLDMAAYESEHECDWTVGAFMAVRREALLSAGVMDERFFLQCEEPDLCMRLKQAGWSVRHLPVMTIVHHAGKAGPSPRMSAQEVYARRQYAQKYFTAGRRRMYLGAIAARHVLRAASTRGSSEVARRRRAASLSALRALRHPANAPFCEPPAAAAWVGPPAGPRPKAASQPGRPGDAS